jgi:hypothetical protein
VQLKRYICSDEYKMCIRARNLTKELIGFEKDLHAGQFNFDTINGLRNICSEICGYKDSFKLLTAVKVIIDRYDPQKDTDKIEQDIRKFLLTREFFGEEEKHFG